MDATVGETYDTRKCEGCKLDLDASYYSMGPDLFSVYATKIVSNGHSRKALCNSCRLANPASQGIAFLAMTSYEWMKLSACTPANSGMDFKKIDLMLSPSPLEAQERPWAPLCDYCPVKAKCAELQRETDATGVWGGEWFPAKGQHVPVRRPEEGLRGPRGLLYREKCGKGHDLLKPGALTQVKDHGKTAWRCLACRRENAAVYRGNKKKADDA